MIYCERSELGGSFVCLPRKTIWLRGAGRACRVRRDDHFGPLTQAGCGRFDPGKGLDGRGDCCRPAVGTWRLSQHGKLLLVVDDT